MRVSDFIIDYLERLGIKEVFVVYGAANGDLIDSFIGKKNIRYIASMHEQAAGFAAEGYAKVSENFGVAIATSGPGGGNLVTPIQNCFYDSVPCLFITGQINSQFLRKDFSIRQVGFQETDIVETVRGITKYAVMITNPSSVKYELEKAFFLMKEGRPGPVLLDIPIDIQKKEIDINALQGFNSDFYQLRFDDAGLKLKIFDYLYYLQRSKRPVILVGGGIRTAHAVDELLRVGDLLKIPIFPTWNALDVVTSDYEYYGGRIGTYGGPGRNFGIQNADLLLCVGTRISGRITGGNVKTFARTARKYLVDVDKALLERKNQQVPCDVNIFCDARVFLRNLINIVESEFEKIFDFSVWMDRVIEWREKYDPVRLEYYERQDIVDPYVFFRILSEEMGSDDILVGDCGGNIVISNHAFKTKRGQRNITNNGNSPMGFSFAAAMGAWFASDKRRNVVCTIGDGGFNMNIQEIQTLLNYRIGIKTFIIDNRIYGITKAFHEFNFKRSVSACGGEGGYVPPDFVKICQAYGVKTFAINSNSLIRHIIRSVLDIDGPVVVIVNCPNHYSYEPRMVGWKNPIEDMYPFLPRDEFRKNMIIDPIEDWEKNIPNDKKETFKSGTAE